MYPKTKDSLQEMQILTMADFIVDINGMIIKPQIVRRKNKIQLSPFELEFIKTIKKCPSGSLVNVWTKWFQS